MTIAQARHRVAEWPVDGIGSRFIRAGLATALIDGTFSSVLSVAAYGSTVTRLFQGVASTLLGSRAIDGGTLPAVIGVLMHIGVAFGWSAVFLFGLMRSPAVRHWVSTPAGIAGVAAVYGPAIWMVMSLIVIPALLHRPPTVSFRWWVQFVGHFPFVGLPIVASSAWRHGTVASI